MLEGCRAYRFELLQLASNPVLLGFQFINTDHPMVGCEYLHSAPRWVNIKQRVKLDNR
jgi:hypothetical protein